MRVRSALVLLLATVALVAPSSSESSDLVQELHLPEDGLGNEGTPLDRDRVPLPQPPASRATADVEEETDAPTPAPTTTEDEDTPIPTPAPTKKPATKNPTPHPTKATTLSPTKNPTQHPTKHPTKYPTASPTETPKKICLIYHGCSDCIKANNPNPEEHTQGYCDWGYDTLVGKHVCFQTEKAVTASVSDVCTTDTSSSSALYLAIAFLIVVGCIAYKRMYPSSPLASLIDGDGNAPGGGASSVVSQLERGEFERTPLTSSAGSASRADDWDWDEGGGGGGGSAHTASEFDGRSQVDIEMTRLERHRREEEDIASSRAREREREREAQDRAAKKANITPLTAGKARPASASNPGVPITSLGGASKQSGLSTSPPSSSSERQGASPVTFPPPAAPKAVVAPKAADPDDIFASFGIAAKPKFGASAPPPASASPIPVLRQPAPAPAAPAAAKPVNDGWQKDDLDDLLDFS